MVERSEDFTIGAVKILVDDSPQGMTAFLSQPYLNAKDKGENFRGLPLIEQEELTELVVNYHRAGVQLALHGNGDAAIEFIINAVEIAQSRFYRNDARHIIVHAQTIRQDQLQRLAALGMTPSFFNSHTYFWGDWYLLNALGPDRAATISPTGWALSQGLRFTLHSDAPVTPMNPLQLVWSANTRKTLAGNELGASQRIGINTALRALTIDAAWQNHREQVIGSLVPGKFADFIVLSGDPFNVPDVRDLQVLATFIDGVKHFGQIDRR